MEDPRTISSSIDLVFVAKAIERVGDHAKNLAEQIIYIVKGTDVRHNPVGTVEIAGALRERTATMSRILVVEDEPAIAELISINLRHAGFEVTIAGDAEQAQVAVDGVLPDLVVLDWMLPGQSGLALARRWRSEPRTRELPIIMLTARAEEADKVAGLDAGADDYLTKPFSTNELLARIRARAAAPARPRRSTRRSRSARCGSIRRRAASRSQRPRGQDRRRPSSGCCTS